MTTTPIDLENIDDHIIISKVESTYGTIAEDFKDFLSISERDPASKRTRSTKATESTSKLRRYLTDEQKKILDDWLNTHLDNPYPSDVEKEELCSQTGMSKKQLQTWFANARHRRVSKAVKSGLVPPHIKQLKEFQQKAAEMLQQGKDESSSSKS